MVDLLLYVTLPVVTALGLLAFFLRRPQQSPRPESLPAPASGTTPADFGGELEVQVAHFNPLASLSFATLVNGNDQGLATMEQEANTFLSSVAKQYGGDFSNALLQLAGALGRRGAYMAKFSPEGQKAIQTGAATLMKDKFGKNLLSAVTKDGRIVNNAREIGPVASSAAKVANLAAIVVSAAHIVSGYDNAKRLKAIDKNVDLLLQCNNNEMLAKLEAVFEVLRERFATDAVPNTVLLNHIKSDLKQLRIGWLRQVEYSLQHIDDPEQRDRLSKWFSRTFGGDKDTAKNIVSAVTAQEVNVHLVRVTIFLEEVIASVLGEHNVFTEITVPGISAYLHRLEALLLERKDFVAKLINEPPQSIEAQAGLVAALRQSLNPPKDDELNKLV